MPDLVWPNVERAVVAWLTDRIAGMAIYTETDAGANPPLPRLEVARVGGTGRGIEKDVDVEIVVHAATRNALWGLVAHVETAMAALAAAGDPYVDDVVETFAFAADPTETSRRRATATYSLIVRPQA